jgi:UPF0716 protein FxsA
MLLFVFFLLFVIVPVAELWLILQVGSMIGVWPTVLLLLLDSIVGVWLVRSQGASVWRRFRAASTNGEIPAQEATEGFLVVIGGMLLIVPGFFSDIVGLVTVLPPTRKLLAGRVVRGVSRRSGVVVVRTTEVGRDDLQDFEHSDQPRRRPAEGQPAPRAEHRPLDAPRT